MYSTFLVSKSECMTCNNKVLKTLGTLQGVFGAEMDRIDGRIIVSHTDEVSRNEIAVVLLSLGFPENKESKAKDQVQSEVQEEQKEIETDEPSIWGCAL